MKHKTFGFVSLINNMEPAQSASVYFVLKSMMPETAICSDRVGSDSEFSRIANVCDCYIIVCPWEKEEERAYDEADEWTDIMSPGDAVKHIVDEASTVLFAAKSIMSKTDIIKAVALRYKTRIKLSSSKESLVFGCDGRAEYISSRNK